ncbi:MAG: PorT family protein [Prevotella sp.]|nr:PorT family protein [Prevotella sp.]
MRKILVVIFVLCSVAASAQVGEFRKDFAIGFNGGYVLSNVDFVPKVPQGYQGGITGGLTLRYTCEKYFKSICAVVAEVNYAQIGWKEDILDMQDQPVPLHTDPSQTLRYSRKINYLQVPVFARLGWGRERNGFQAFFQLGPQLGVYLSDQIDSNFDARNPAFDPLSKEYQYSNKRASHVMAQDTMAIENKFDYGIAAGLGLEFSNRHVGHFMLEGRYYYGLGNIYGNTKRDYFGRSNFGNIVIKFTYLFDVIRTKNSNIK